MAVDAETARRSLHAFVQLFWSVVEPTRPFVDNWHIRVICEHLEAVSRGEIKNLLINVPPGTSKSTLVSVMWPAWEWATDPGLRYFGASYAEPLSIRDAMLCRDIISSDLYRTVYPGVRIKADANQKTHYGLTGGGWRIATSVGGRGTGMHPHRKIVDDAHSAKQADSDAEREAAILWFDGTMSSRGVAMGAATVVVMQRLHEKDLTGHIMASAGYKRDWDHLVIPMEYEKQRTYPTTKKAYKDKRTKDGELLWPQVFDRRKVDTLKATLGEYGSAGQLQQRPSPEGGGIIATQCFRLWPAAAPLPDLYFVLQSYDTAYTDKTINDPTACTVWGIGEHPAPPGEPRTRFAILLDAWTEHMEYPALRHKVITDWMATYGGDANSLQRPARRADVVLLEDKGSGISLRQDLHGARVPVQSYNPGNASKSARAHLAAPLLDLGLFYVLESKRDPGKPISWARPFIQQCEQFPNGEHDDLVDTWTQAAIYLHRSGHLETRSAPREELAEKDYTRSHAAVNPYSV